MHGQRLLGAARGVEARRPSPPSGVEVSDNADDVLAEARSGQGIRDEELIDDVGVSLLVRIESIFRTREATSMT